MRKWGFRRHSGTRLGLLAIVAALAPATLGAGSAQATTVTASTTQVTITDSTGVADNLTFTLQDNAGAHEAVVTDNSRALTPGSGCVQGVNNRQVVCTHPNAAGVFLRVAASLAGRIDRFNATTLTAFGANVNGGPGDDVLTGSSTDASTAVPTANTFDSLDGDDGNDTLVSRAGDDTLTGDAGEDFFVPSQDGAQRLTGGLDQDTANYGAYNQPVTLVIGGGAVSGSAGGDTGVVRAKDQIDGDIEFLKGGNGADTMVGDADAERFDGDSGADNIDGNDGVDEVTYEARSTGVNATLGGTAGVDGEDTITEVAELTGGSGNDDLTGDGNANRLEGRDGDDKLSGADGDDVLVGGLDADDHIGGSGDDEATYADRSDRVSVTVGTVGASGNEDDGAPGSRDTIRSNVERTVGSSDDDTLVGSNDFNELVGGGGADALSGLGNNDLLSGGPGADSIGGGTGNRDVVSYAERAATRPVSVTLGGPAGSSGGRDDGPVDARDTVAGDVEDIVGGAGADTLVGTGAANLFDGGLGADNMQGLGGSDTVTYEVRMTAVSVTVGGGAVSGSSFDITGGVRDTINLDIERVIGSLSGDTLIGGDESQILDGFEGGDTLSGGDDPDTLIGGDGSDTVNYALTTGGGVDVTIGAAGASGNSEDGAAGARDTVSGDVERVQGTSSNDTLTGSANNDDLEGSNGDDTLNGLGGDDALDGAQGNDTFEGGDGDDDMFGGTENDTFDGGPGADLMSGSTATLPGVPGDMVLYDDRSEDLNVNVDAGAVSGSSVDESLGVRDQLTSIETVLGGTGNDTLARVGGALGNFVGGDGNDTLTGASGVDQFEGGPGGDTLTGGVSNDVLDGGPDNDILAGSENDDVLLGGDGDDELDGGANNDQLFGQVGFDTLDGDANNDELDGGNNADTLIGGIGSDLIDGGIGVDVASYEDRDTGTAGSTVSATIGAPGGSGNGDDGPAGSRDTISTDVENLRGGIGNDTLVGNGGPNQIEGGAGGDTIRGGQGIDELLGGIGNDDLFSRDASADDLSCNGGSGDDAEVDASDTVNADCENVTVG